MAAYRFKVDGEVQGSYYKGFGGTAFIEMGDSCCHCIKVDPETVGQYTGLEDKNGTKIFEGDIIRNNVDYLMYKVEYAADCWSGFVLIDIETDDCFDLWELISNVEIVGNIYDNPELMEVADNDREVER